MSAWQAIAICVAAATTVIAVALAVMLVGDRRRLRADHQRLVDERAEWSTEIEALHQQLGQARSRLSELEETAQAHDFVITDLRPGSDHDAGASRRVPDGVVLSTAFGEPMVRALALGHGLRRALSPESRNRIVFEMRREVKRSRKQRRREVRQAVRDVRASQRAEVEA